MSLKRQQSMIAAFSMASMTDVIFLLLIFFMVTSTFVFPTALEINLPESSRQTALKPSARVMLDSQGRVMVATDTESEPQEAADNETLLTFLRVAASQAKPGEEYIAVYADESVTYGRLVEVLDLGAQNNLKMVLATKPAPSNLQTGETANHATR